MVQQQNREEPVKAAPESASAPVPETKEMGEKNDDFYDKTSCNERKKGGKSELIDAEEWRKCHSQAQKEAPKSLASLEKNHKSEKKSDPGCSSAGWCGEPWPTHLKDPSEKVEYKTGLPLDSDIRDTQSHIKGQEAVYGPMTIADSFASKKATS